MSAKPLLPTVKVPEPVNEQTAKPVYVVSVPPLIEAFPIAPLKKIAALALVK
jgi:hypothetical protein